MNRSRLRMQPARRAIVLTALLVAANASAQQPAPQAAADELGRLFFSPQQRQELDRRRQLNIQEVTVTSTDLITVNGQISRSSGKSTTWINGVPQDDTHKGKDPTAVTLGGSETESSVTIKIGQTIDKTRGAITDGLAGGEVKTRPAAPAKAKSREPR